LSFYLKDYERFGTGSKKKYINNEQAREITSIVQAYKMSALFRKWVKQGLLVKIQPTTGAKKNTRYKLANQDDLGDAR
jgi:plasmid replication initiation protein